MSDLQSVRCHIYRRVSTAERKSGSVSLDWQLQVCRAWIAAEPLRVESGDYVDDGVSAGIPIMERDRGQALTQKLREGDTVIVARLDRGWRDVLDFRRAVEVWGVLGARIRSASEPYDLSTPAGLMTATMVVAVSEYERRLIGERSVAAKKVRRAAGLRADAEPPYGWSHVTVDDPAAPTGKRVVVSEDAYEQETAKLAYELWQSGMSWAVVAKRLDARGIKPRHSKRWSRHTVRLIVAAWDRAHPGTKSEG